MRRLLLALPILLLAAAGVGGWFYHQLDAPGPLPATANIVVPRGGLAELAQNLQQQGVVAQPLVFRAFALLTMSDGPLHAGELAFPTAASVR